jgi:prepilin-type N-terminal cleavage/methylation domain-containing protein
MRRLKKGVTLIETLLAVMISSVIMFAALTLWISGSRFFMNTETDVEITRENSSTLRRISERLRGAIDVTISEDGKRITYMLPERLGFHEQTTGENEYALPVRWDGVERGYEVVGDKLINIRTQKVLVDHIIAYDPDPKSTQFDQEYRPFSATSIGSKRAVTVNLITLRPSPVQPRYVRMKTSALLRNRH